MSRLALAASCLAALVASTAAIVASPLRLQPSRPIPGQPLHVLVTGAEDARHVVEASTSLRHWFPLLSATATNGQFSFDHSPAPNWGAVFYRVRQEPPPIQVVPQVDSNQVAFALVTMEAGGSCALTNDRGVAFKFTVGPSNVLEPVAVAMRLITNFSSFPASGAMREAVVFEPDGFEFWGAGRLEIRFPTNLPTLKVSSYAFESGGSNFHLVPDLVASNRVVIPVVHFSALGTATWELEQRAQVIHRFQERYLDRLREAVGSELAIQRDLALLGSEDPSFKFSDTVNGASQEFYEFAIEPYLEEAKKNCALAGQLTEYILSLERQRQLLGCAPEKSEWESPLSVVKGGAGCNCVQGWLNQCKDHVIGAQELMSRLLGLERQRQLLGTSDGSVDVLAQCGLGDLGSLLEDPTKLPCITDWLGQIDYTESGSFTTNWTELPNNSRTQTESTTADMTLLVSEAALEDSGGSPGDPSDPPYERWKLILTGKYAMRESILDRTVGTSAWNTWEHEEITEAAGEGTVAIKFGLLFEWGILKEFTEGNVSSQANLARIDTDGVYRETTVYKDKQGAVTSRDSKQWTFIGGSEPAWLWSGLVKTNLLTAFITNHVAGTIIETNVAHEMKRGVKITYGIDFQRRPK